MKDGQWYSIAGWMGKYLELRGNDLICFAVIYSFSMDGESQFKGNLHYLCSCMFATKPTVLLALNHLLECNLIIKQEDVENGKKRCFYSTNIIYDEGRIEVIESDKKPISMISKEPLPNTGKESLPNTGKEPLPKEYSNKDNINNKEKRLSNDNQKKEEYSNEFEEFWKVYGFYRGKGEAYKRWKKLSVKDKKDALSALPAYFADCKANNRQKRYPSVYISKRTWEDDFTSEEAEDEEVKWDEQKIWLSKYVPNIADKITRNVFKYIKYNSFCDRSTVSSRLREMNESYDGSDIVEFFKKKYL